MKTANGSSALAGPFLFYICLKAIANAQLIDQSAQLSNQIDSNVIQVLTTPNPGPVGPPTATTFQSGKMSQDKLRKAIAELVKEQKAFLDSIPDDQMSTFASAVANSPLSGGAVQVAVSLKGPGAVTRKQLDDLIDSIAHPSASSKSYLEALASPKLTIVPLIGGHPTHPPAPIQLPVNARVTWKDYGKMYLETESADYQESKFKGEPASWSKSLEQAPVILTGIYNRRNSLVGKGTTDTYTGQAGWSYQTPFALTIQPSVSYQTASTQLSGSNTFNSNTYGCSVNLAQKIVPFDAITENQPAAALNIPNGKPDAPCRYQPWTAPDHYPSWDLLLNFNAGFNDANTETLVRNWVYSTQDNYSFVPGATFDFYNKKTSDGFGDKNDWTSLLPSAISVSPSWAEVLSENQVGQSASMGAFSLSERNLYLFSLEASRNPMDCDQAPSQSLEVVQINTISHDTNQEGFTPPTSHVEYQTWATFGLALLYSNTPPQSTADAGQKRSAKLQVPTARLEYDYVAFNNQYQGHTVTLTVNFKFW